MAVLDKMFSNLDSLTIEELEELQSRLDAIKSSRKDDVEQEINHKELVKVIDSFLDRLPADKRGIFISRYWHTDSISEIAVRHGMTDGAVSMTLNRLRLKLHNYLLERDFEL